MFLFLSKIGKELKKSRQGGAEILAHKVRESGDKDNGIH